MKTKKYKCSKCGIEAEYEFGIGEYCPNPDCDNMDYDLEEVKGENEK